MKQWNNVRNSNQDNWLSNVMVLERDMYMQAPLLIRIVGGVLVASQHWVTTKSDKRFPLWCPSYNTHTEAHDLLFCQECWSAFEVGQGERPYHSDRYQVYDANNQLIENADHWVPRGASDTRMCPIHATPLQKVPCGLCDLLDAGFDGKIQAATPKYIFNVLVRTFQDQGQENPLRVMELSGKVMSQVNKLSMFNQGAHPSDPDKGADFYLQYDKGQKIWTTQLTPPKPLTEAEKALPLWRVDHHYRAAEAASISQAIERNDLKQKKPEEGMQGQPQATGMPAQNMMAAPPVTAPVAGMMMGTPPAAPAAPVAAVAQPAPVAVAQPAPVAVAQPAPVSPVATTEPVQPAPVAAPVVPAQEAGAAVMKDCFGEWSSQPDCMRCELRMGCIEKANAAGGA